MLTRLENRWLSACYILIAASCVLIFFHLGGRALQDYDEGIYAQVIKDTVRSDDVLTLKQFGNPWFEKPPLYFWLAIATQRIFPDPEFAYRLPSAIAGVISVILVMLISYEATGRYPIAFLSGLILLTSPPFLEAARQMRLDVPTVAGVLFAFYAFLRAKNEPLWYIWCGIGVSLAILFKSAIGLLAIPIILVWSVVFRDFDWIRAGRAWLGVLAGIVVLLPWHLYETIQFGSRFWSDYVGVHILRRFDANIIGGTAATNATYIDYLFTFALPWSVVFIACCIWLFKNRGGDFFKPALTFSLQVVFLIALFFASGTKLAHYLIPAYPFAALSIATVGFLAYSTIRNDSRRKLAILFAGTLFAIALFHTIWIGFHYEKHMRTNDLLARDEKNIGLVLKREEPFPVYVYKYNYWDTIRFYGDVTLDIMRDDQLLDRPFYLILPRGLYDIEPFPPELQVRFMLLFKGEAVVLLRYDLTPNTQ